MMDPTTLHPTPRWPVVVKEQLRSVWTAIRGMVGVAAALATAVILFLSVYALRVGESIPVTPEVALPVTLASLLLPILVWKDGYHFRRSYLASMPVDQKRHVLVKLAAGWIWLMFLVGALLLLVFGLAVVTGGSIGIDEMRVIAEDLPSGASAEEAAALARRWTTPAWQWAVFFTGSTAAYLTGSAVVLASSRTRRWLAGTAFACMFVIIIDDEAMHLGGVAEGIERAVQLLVAGRYGFEQFLGWANAYHLTRSTGEYVVVWNALPSVEEWLAAALLWIGSAAALVLAVVWFDRKA